MDLMNQWQDWEILAGDNSLTLLAPNEEALELIDSSMMFLLKQRARLIDIFLSVGGVKHQVRPIPTRMINPKTPLKDLLPAAEDPDWKAIAESLDIPVWVFHHYNLRTLWANHAALAPQAKPKEEIINADASGLDKPEELERIARLLELDGAINAMDFRGYRWGILPENQRIYTRVEHEFVEHWKLINWEGQPARLGVVLQASPVADGCIV